MPVEVVAAIIAGIVALIVGFLTVVASVVTGREQLKQNNEKNRKDQELELNKFREEQEKNRKDQELELNKFREEQEKWIINLNTAYVLENHKTRIESYPKAFEIIGKLSHKPRESVTPEKAKQIADELNDWFYSTGGMCADQSTRGAIRLLRNACLTWKKQGSKPPDFYKWRNCALLLLRNDLGIKGLESFDYENVDTLIERAKKVVSDATKKEITQEDAISNVV